MIINTACWLRASLDWQAMKSCPWALWLDQNLETPTRIQTGENFCSPESWFSQEPLFVTCVNFPKSVHTAFSCAIWWTSRAFAAGSKVVLRFWLVWFQNSFGECSMVRLHLFKISFCYFLMNALWLLKYHVYIWMYIHLNQGHDISDSKSVCGESQPPSCSCPN